MPVTSTARFRGRFLFTDTISEVSTGIATLPASLIFTIGGTANVAGDTLAITLIPVAGANVVSTYTVMAADIASGTLPVQQSTIAGNLAALINQNIATANSVFTTATTGSSNSITVRYRDGSTAGNTARASAANTPGTVGHATISPTASTLLTGGGATNTTENNPDPNPVAHQQITTPAAFIAKHANNPQLMTPAVSGDVIFNFCNASSYVSFNAGEPIMIDAPMYAAAIAAGISFQPQ